MLLIRAQHLDSGPVDVTISDIRMDSADSRDLGQGRAPFIEQCICPVGYTGLSCEICAPGYQRQEGGRWKGTCQRPAEPCPPGYYGDPMTGMECQVCPCPLTTPSNQFARECYLDVDRQVTCRCPPGYTGRRCGECAQGFVGNPTVLGSSCQRGEYRACPSILCVKCSYTKIVPQCCVWDFHGYYSPSLASFPR